MIETRAGDETYFSELIQWPRYSIAETVIFIFFIIVIVMILYRAGVFYLTQKQKKEHIRHLFLYKARDAGLSTYQHNILNSIASLTSPENPLKLFQDPSHFEKAVIMFLNYALKNRESVDSMKKMIMDIIIINEKLFQSSQYRKPLEDFRDFDKGSLAAIYSENIVTAGRIVSIDEKIGLKPVSRTPKPGFAVGSDVELFIWRSGDAGYTLPCKIADIKNRELELIPSDIPERGDEERYPLITTFIPCTLTHISEPEDEKEDGESDDKVEEKKPSESIPGRLIRLNLNEFEAQAGSPVEPGETYLVSFSLSGLDIEAEVKALSERSLSSDNYHIVSFRVEKVTDAEKNILRDYIFEHL